MIEFFNTLADRGVMFILGTIFWLSDLLFPLWLIGIVVLCKRKGLKLWKAWLFASTFCLVQAYLVAKLIGWNVGAYALIGIGGILFYNLPRMVRWYIMPFLIVVILPTIIIYLLSKYIQHRNIKNHSVQ